MNNELIIIVGLPGSGKTHKRKNEFSDSTKYRVFDDVKNKAVLGCGDFPYSQHYPDIINEMRASTKHIVISDIDFCNYQSYKRIRDILDWWINEKKYRYSIKLIVFENAPDKCRNNVAKQIGKDEKSKKNRKAMINRYSPIYDPIKYVENSNEILSIHEVK